MADIEKIKSNVDEIKKSVSDLKSEIETFDKEKNTLQKNIIDQKQQEIDNKKNEIEKKKKETQDLIEKARNEYINLKLDDLDEATKKTVQEEKTKNEALLNEYEKELKAIETDKKSFWEKVKDGGNKVVNYVKANPGKSLLLATGIGALLYFIFRKKKKNKEDGDGKENDSEKKTPRRKKALIWTGVIAGTAGIGVWGYKHWSEIKGWFLDLLGKNLTFEEAMTKVKSDLSNVSESDLNVELGLEYDEAKKSIISYGKEKIKIDKKKKRVEGLDVSFPNYEEMIHAANIINYAKYAYTGKCKSNSPFYITKLGGDIEVKLLDEDGKEMISGEGVQVGTIAGGSVGSILALLAGYCAGPTAGLTTGLLSVPGGAALGHYLLDGQSTLGRICPTLADGIGKKKLLDCLNKLPNLTQGDQEYEPDSKSPLQKQVNEVIREIKKSEVDEDIEFKDQGLVRELQADVDPKDPTLYIIKSRKKEIKIKLEGKNIKVEGLDIEFEDIKEGIRVANLTNYIKYKCAGKYNNNSPFSYKSGRTTLGEPGLYGSKEKSRNLLNGDTYKKSNWIPNKLVSKDMLEKRYPILLENIETKYIPYLHDMKSKSNRSLWINPNE